jgi:hypothetical protein
MSISSKGINLMSENSNNAWVIFVERITPTRVPEKLEETVVYESTHGSVAIHALVLADLDFCQALEGNQFVEVTGDPIFDQFCIDQGLVFPLYRFSKPMPRGAQKLERFIDGAVDWMPHALWIW